ncbi:hypothetical protein GIV19_20330 [Pseudomonas syringae]|uniref:hypothetical protein n=1 Tax=Pseudomonas syringae TaxID=317 RepID=UPI001F45DC94|nr:hypothetical protein [Pseudomonas syringae]MCF5709611.1 hypothetical protein [Pseudomonas syringae]
MSHGLATWGADGQPQLDENSFTMRIAASFLVTFSGATKQVQTFDAPGCNTSNSVAVLVPIAAYDQNARQHEAAVQDNGTVNVYNYMTGNGAVRNVSFGTMRLMVVRFK